MIMPPYTPPPYAPVFGGDQPQRKPGYRVVLMKYVGKKLQKMAMPEVYATEKDAQLAGAGYTTESEYPKFTVQAVNEPGTQRGPDFKDWFKLLNQGGVFTVKPKYRLLRPKQKAYKKATGGNMNLMKTLGGMK